jgi:hypothetical protein
MFCVALCGGGLEVGNLLAQSGRKKCVRAGARFLGYFGQLGCF